MSRGSEGPRIEYRSPNIDRGRGGERPRAIVVHTTDGTFDAAAAWFLSRASGVSAHYLVALDGRIAQFVDEADTARHAGRISRPSAMLARAAGAEGVNAFTIGVEFDDDGGPLTVARTDAQYDAGGRLIAEIAARWEIPLDRGHVLGHREVFADKDCPGNLDVDRLLASARAAGGAGGEDPAGLALLLPARDAAGDIPGYLETAAALGGSVIALDDGSADATAELLEASPLVRTVLRNPPRPGFAGWDDGENRRRLLAAARELDPEWLLFLDADERLDGADAAALRKFLAGDALGGVAYSLELYREWEGRVVAEPTHVFRLFANDRELSLPGDRFHFNPVPVEIPRPAWLRTSIRARHLDSPERLERRRRKYAEADPGAEYAGATAALLEAPSNPTVEWPQRDPDLPVLGARRSRPAAPAGDRHELVCLLPARNCAADIPGYLESAAAVADGVIALDDGSTDATAEALDASPLVLRVLRSPRRESYAGWDDAANRQALLDAAIELGPRWVLFLDADERIAPDDALALRRFVEHEARPGWAYGFRVHRMLGDRGGYDRAGLWVYRLFAPEPGQGLPEATLHAVPVPTSIPHGRREKTTVRIRHYGGATPERRRARLRKYEEADPELRWQGEYRRTLLDAGEAQPWRSRPAGLPVLADPSRSGVVLDLEELDPGAPVLSAIVIARDDAATIERSVRAVVDQECESFEVIVVVSGSPETAAVVRTAFGDRVALVELAERALPGRARNAGLERARGEYVSFPGSHVELPPGSLAARVDAHERGAAMVTGSIVNGNRTAAGWAAYFLDHSTALPGRPSAELAGPPAHCSYVREFLLEAGGFPEDLRAGEDTVVNEELWRRGHRAWREQRLELIHRSPCTTPWRLARHHFQRGRAFGRILRGDFEPRRRRRRASSLRFMSSYPRRMLASTDTRVENWGGPLGREYRRVRRLVRLAIAAAALGTYLELLRPLRRSSAPERRTLS